MSVGNLVTLGKRERKSRKTLTTTVEERQMLQIAICLVY